MLPIGILLLLLVLTTWLSRYVALDTERTRDLGRNDPDVIVERFTATKLSPTGDVQYTVTAKTMAHFPADDSSTLEDVVFTSTVTGQPTLVATAPRGRLLAGGDQVVMEGGVVVNSGQTGQTPAMTLRTPSMTVLPEKSTASSSEGVVVESVQGVINAAQFELNNATRTLRMSSINARLVSRK
jgi:lipopolysaccharide export system protein LptC